MINFGTWPVTRDLTLNTTVVQMPQITCIEESFSKPWLLDAECQQDDGSSSSSRYDLDTANWWRRFRSTSPGSSKHTSWQWLHRWPWQSYQGFRCYHGLQCSSPRYLPFGAVSWGLGLIQYQYHEEQGSGGPELNRTFQSPCRALCGAWRSCYPSSLDELEQLTAWPRW